MTTKHLRALFRLSIPVCLLAGLLLATPALVVRSAPAAPTAAVIAVTTTVDDFGGGVGCSLREAIQSANLGSNFGGCTGANASANTISLPAGTYTLTGAAGENNNVSGDLDIRANVTINGADEKTTFIQAGTNTSNGVDRVLHVVLSDITVEINNVTIRYGRTPDGIDGASDDTCTGGHGGGIYSKGTLTLNDCVVAYNCTGDGGDGCTSADVMDGNGGYGGGIYVLYSTLELNDTTVRSNETGAGGDGGAGGDAYIGGRGGGIYLYSSSAMTLTDSLVSGNVTGDGGNGGDAASGDAGNGLYGGQGGGIYSRGTLTLIGSTVDGNTTGAGGDGGNASSGDGGNGGNGGDGAGIYDEGGTTVLVESILSNNETGLGGSAGSGSGFLSDGYRGKGGGLASNSSLATLNDTTISDNRGLLGGGVYGVSEAVVTLGGCTVSGNIADESGGGIYNSSGGALALTNSTVSSNRAYKHGGGILNGGGTIATLTHVTVVYNTADLDDDGDGDGGGFFSAGTFTMTNTLVAGNTDKGYENPDCRGTVISGDYNLLGEDSADCTFTPQPHDQVGTTGSPINPGVALNLEDNGGPTLTHALKPSSPAVDQIPAGVNGCGGGSRDQRGVLRFPPCSIGSYEPDQAEEVYLPLVVKD